MKVFDVIESPALPPGTALIYPAGFVDFDGDRVGVGPIIFQRDPWGPDRFTDPAVEAERRKGLDFLADLLDGMCRDLGMDPDETWRDPKIREQDRRMESFRIRADLRYGLQVNRPECFVLTGIG